MLRTRIPVGILLIFTLASSIIIIAQSNPAFAMEPVKLKIYVGPTNVPADNSSYECIFVQLQDSSSIPARALEDITISLSSSLTSVGSVDPAVTIAAGNTYAIAKFDSTFTPGTTTIAATASGYATVQASMVTVAPVPSKLAVYGFPPVLPADGIQYEAIVVQLQDSGSNPAKAPLGGVSVALFSSDETIATVATSVTIGSGQAYTLANITCTAPGSTTITAMASGYTSKQATIAAQTPLTNPPKILRLYSAPPKIIADNSEHPQIVVQLLDETGKITQQPSTMTPIQLSSSNENVGSIQPAIDVPAGKVFTPALFSATYKAGTTTITAAASGLQTDTETITTIGPNPSKIAVYCSPSAVPADNEAYTAIQVQLQDASGKPALDPNGEVTVSLFSSEPTVGTVPTTLTIPYGYTYATALFTSTYLASSTSITAQASGYTTGQAQMKTCRIEQPLLSGTMQICVKDNSNQGSVSDANVSILSQKLGTTNLTATTNSTGYVAFPNCKEGNYTLKVDKQGYFPMNTTFSFKTTSSSRTLYITKIDDSQPASDQTMTLLLSVAAVGGIVVAVVVLTQIRKKRRARDVLSVPKS